MYLIASALDSHNSQFQWQYFGTLTPFPLVEMRLIGIASLWEYIDFPHPFWIKVELNKKKWQ